MANKMTKHEQLCDNLCSPHGIMIEVNRVHGKLELQALAADGMHFRSEGLHTLVECQTDEPDDRVWARLYHRILDGLDRCSDGGCNGDCELAMLD